MANDEMCVVYVTAPDSDTALSLGQAMVDLGTQFLRQGVPIRLIIDTAWVVVAHLSQGGVLPGVLRFRCTGPRGREQAKQHQRRSASRGSSRCGPAVGQKIASESPHLLHDSPRKTRKANPTHNSGRSARVPVCVPLAVPGSGRQGAVS